MVNADDQILFVWPSRGEWTGQGV